MAAEEGKTELWALMEKLGIWPFVAVVVPPAEMAGQGGRVKKSGLAIMQMTPEA